MDDFDKLAEGKQFETRTSGDVIDAGWVQATVGFDTHRLEYYVELDWDGSSVSDTFDSKIDAVDKYEELCETHGLNDC